MGKLIIGNWKMNPQSEKEAESIFDGVNKGIKNSKNVNIIICSPFPFLFVYKKLKMKKIKLGAQDISVEVGGSYTGEVSPSMLSDLGVSYVIVGHSERRKLCDNNKIVNKKLLNALKSKISPVLCIGENLRGTSSEYLLFIKNQLKECLDGVSKIQMKNIIIAYEPVWAIGKDSERGATSEEFMEMKIYIKKILSDIYGLMTAHSTPIIYGGSVNRENANEFIKKGNADGLLVGRDSLSPKKFIAIIKTIK